MNVASTSNRVSRRGYRETFDGASNVSVTPCLLPSIRRDFVD